MDGLDSKRRIFLRVMSFVATGSLLALPSLGITAPTAQPTRDVGIIYGTQAACDGAVAVMRSDLKARHASWLLAEIPRGQNKEAIDNCLAPIWAAGPRILVTVGLSPTAAIFSRHVRVPLIFCMIPNILDAPFLAGAAGTSPSITGITTDVAPSEQIDWILKLAPGLKSLGIPCSGRSQNTARALQAAGRARQLPVLLIPAKKEAFGAALRTLAQQECAGVLMLPDAGVYNCLTVRELLLWGIRQKRPVWTFSENIVKAGALASRFSTPEALGHQTARRVQRILEGDNLSRRELLYPDSTRTAVNERTAELIGITLNEDVLKTVTRRYGRD